ncbi:MAG: head-tail connector protein [Lachnospiraceae bacterium]|nr:head-tail connector protein [Lachnospiraceae bacterium]MCH4028356.1 head-tail connector protein [Lachnospiraceae bacterium]MCH4066202.1 head-tail connector protein [Lachnospiraceae bacterium]MCH4112236.1 head-tail connector protein [Lachnospiraceae bacterium]
MLKLEEAKQYLRVDANDEDDVIQQELDAAESLVASVLRKESLEDESSPITVVAVLYALAYLNEHREEADHHALTITLRNLLFGERDARF